MKKLFLLLFVVCALPAYSQDFNLVKEIGFDLATPVDSIRSYWAARGAQIEEEEHDPEESSYDFYITNTGEAFSAAPERIRVSAPGIGWKLDGKAKISLIEIEYTSDKSTGGKAYEYLKSVVPKKDFQKKKWVFGTTEATWAKRDGRFMVNFSMDYAGIAKRLEAEEKEDKKTKVAEFKPVVPGKSYDGTIVNFGDNLSAARIRLRDGFFLMDDATTDPDFIQAALAGSESMQVRVYLTKETGAYKITITMADKIFDGQSLDEVAQSTSEKLQSESTKDDLGNYRWRLQSGDHHAVDLALSKTPNGFEMTETDLALEEQVKKK
ncbi:MAG: hypothetical protein V4642_03620 [Bacteroidota bacterium]